ncbi:hypothetical protein AMECASPLE_024877 [Ameca splendens]|uniref:Uncharacterized protein n=1 Tax=Ameca splendens TaxID=208324 RepID=A0ABV1AC74_9TELE
MVDDFISEELSEVTEVKEISGISVDSIQPIENHGLGERAAPLSFAKKKNKGVGVRIKKFLQKYSEGRHNRVAPEFVFQEELGDKETKVTALQNFMPEESNLSTGVKVIDEEQESEVTVISVCKEEILKPARESNIIKSFFSSVGKALLRPFKRF